MLGDWSREEWPGRSGRPEGDPQHRASAACGHAGVPIPRCVHGAQAWSGSELEEPSERHADQSPKVPSTRLPHNVGMDRCQGVMGEEWLLGPQDPSSCQVTTPAGYMLKGDGGDAGGQRQARA